MSAQAQYYAENQGPTQTGQTSKVYKLGITELVLGSLVIFVGIVTLVLVFVEFSYLFINLFTDTPFIWCGIVAIITGILGVRLKTQPIKSVYMLNMAMAIICSVVALSALVLSGIKASQFAYFSTVLAAGNAGMAVLSAALMFVGIAHALLCHSGACSDQGFGSGTQQAVNLSQQYAAP